jgi:hypothetical protein
MVFELGPEPSSWGSAEDERPKTPSATELIVPAPVAIGPLASASPIALELRAYEPVDAIHYSLDGGEPTRASPVYERPLELAPPAIVTFRARRGNAWSPVVGARLLRLDARRRVTLAVPPDPQYGGGGDHALVDGLTGGADFRLGGWQGFHGVELEATVDLGAPRPLSRVSTGFLRDERSWIFLPHEVRYGASDDGAAWRPLGTVPLGGDSAPSEPAVRHEASLDLTVAVTARYLRVTTISRLVCPPGHPGTGEPAWVFADEIVVE